MQTIELVLNRPHEAQAHIKGSAQRFNVGCCGRRFGKTLLGEDLTHPDLLAGYPVGWYSPTYKMLAEVWRDLKNLYAPLTTGKSEVEKRIELVTGGILEMWSLDDPGSSRGRKYKRVIVDEAAKVRKLEEAWTEVIRQTLADYQGDAWFFSTPKGLNYFYTLWNRAEDAGNWNRWRYTTYDNPYIPHTEIDSMRHELPERVFQQEILAEFIEDGAYFQGVNEAAIIEHPSTPAQHKDHYLVMGVDWAISQDWTVIVVGCRDCNQVVDWDRFNKIDFTYQREKLIAMAKRWNVSGCLPERNSIGQPNIEIIRTKVAVLNGPDGKQGFNTTATTKPGLIQGLASAIEHEGFLVPAEAAEELRVYEVETLQSGHPKFGAPEGMHDDWVIALALLWRAIASYTWLL